MAVFRAMLGALNLTSAQAAEVFDMAKTTVDDMARGKTRLPPGLARECATLFERVESAADDIIADQGELDGGEGLLPLTVDVDAIPLPHPGLREAAVARAMLVLGPRLLELKSAHA